MVITGRNYLKEYSRVIGNRIPALIEHFDFPEGEGSFDYLTKSSAVYSSNIEGNSIDLNSFMNYTFSKEKLRAGREIEEIEHLIRAYEFAQNNKPDESNFLNAHKLLSKTLLIKSKQGRYRTERVGVFSASGLAYLAVEPEFVAGEMRLFFDGFNELVHASLTPEESFYFASWLHLRFVHIHPFRDGNGRAARLLEKWFLAEKLGSRFWKIPSEKYYRENQRQYYAALNLGLNFYELNYDKCMDFLIMLPNCLKS
jgi:Fic family protein